MKIQITKISNQHLLNRIKYFEKKMFSRPEEMIYIGDSDYAEGAVESENRQNEMIAEVIEAHLKYMKKEAKKRNLNLISPKRAKSERSNRIGL